MLNNYTDNRTTDRRRMREIEVGQYFIYDDVLFRRVTLYDGFTMGEYDGLPVCEIRTGIVCGLCYDTWVLPLAERQVCTSLED